jgi:hypothetical protein
VPRAIIHFPDVRIEYEDPDGRWGREDVEVVTPHYRGAHGASVARSGFSEQLDRDWHRLNELYKEQKALGLKP